MSTASAAPLPGVDARGAAGSGSKTMRVVRSLGPIPLVALAGCVVGAGLLLTSPLWADRVWLAVLVSTGSIVVVRTVRRALAGRWASDVIAALAIVGAIAMHQPLA